MAGGNVQQFLEDLLGTKLDPRGGNGNASTKCVCHDDSTNSMSVEVNNGLWFCHAQGTGGNLAKMIQLVRKCDVTEAYKIAAQAGITKDQILDGAKQKKQSDTRETDFKPVPQEIVDLYIRNLFGRQDLRDRALRDFGWTEETIKRFSLGYDFNTKRYTIPIPAKNGTWANVRLYNPDTVDGKMKVTSYNVDFGISRLYPQEYPEADVVILVEGEKDSILTNQMLDVNDVQSTIAITHTTGAGTWKKHWAKRFEGKEVWICYDQDEAGDAAPARVANSIQDYATKVKIIKWPEGSANKYDITDFFVKDAHHWADFIALVDATEYWTKQSTAKYIKQPKDDTIYKPHLSEASSEKYLHKNQELTVLVAGKDTAPFAVPRKRIFSCGVNYGKACQSCALAGSNGLKTIEYAPDDPKIIKFVNITDDQQDLMIRKEHGINTRCPKVEIDTTEETNLEELTIVPEIDFAEEDRPYERRTMFTNSHGVQPNKTYTIRGTTVPHPKTQHVVHFAWDIEPAQDNIDDFIMTPELMKELQVFQPAPGQTIHEKFTEIAEDLTYNVTRIEERHDIIMAVDLCYHTVLNFEFNNSPVAKAWGDILILGDPRTGKSETVEKLIKHYMLGEMTVSENTTKAGLFGGLTSNAGGRWSITWGRIPLNDRRLLAIDESSGLETEVIGSLSGLRSSGLAEITKIHTERTLARTRLIWISNPRSAKSLSQYSHGVEAVKELMGEPADVARLDFVVTAAAGEVALDRVNMAFGDKKSIPHVYTSNLSKELVRWSWSRKSHHITFTPEAADLILGPNGLATEQAKRYVGGQMPLVEAGNHRLKLAKLAVAAAIRTFSTDDGENVIVRPEHVQFVADFLDTVFSKPSLDYSGYSQNIIDRTTISPEDLAKVHDWIKSHGDWAKLWKRNDELRLEDFRNQFTLDLDDVKRLIIQPLTQLNMIERNKRSAFVKTEIFIREIKRIEHEFGLSDTVMGIGGASTGSSSSSAPGDGGGYATGSIDYNDDDIPF